MTVEHVEHGRELLQREEVTRGILGLNDHERILLYALSTFTAREETPVRSRKLYQRYENLATNGGTDALTSRWMHDHLDELEMLGLVSVTKRNEGSSGGQYKMITLNQDLEPVLDALEETIHESDVHTSVESWL